MCDMQKNINDIISLGGSFLTPKGFNERSKISVKSYCTGNPKLNWVDVITKNNKLDELKNYVVQEYKAFVKNTNRVNMHQFCKEHEYITYNTLILLGIDEIKEMSDVRKLRYIGEDYKDNFLYVYHIFKRIPLYEEFDKHSKISINAYAEHLGLKGSVYNEIIKEYIKDDNEIQKYYVLRSKLKSEKGKETGKLSKSITDEELEFDFKEKFSYFIEEYDSIPSRRLLQKYLKYDLSTYRNRFKLSWTEICKKYGFDVPKSNNRSEKIALINVSKALSTIYVPQKTWDWLIGAGGSNMYCDGYFPEYNLVVEFDGATHRVAMNAFGGVDKFKRLQENDALKEELLNQNGIKLIRIDSRTNWDKLDYIKSFLIEQGVSKREDVESE